jgi:hypothetical protein
MENIGECSVIWFSTNGKSLVSILNKVSAGTSGDHRKTSADGVTYDSEALYFTRMNCRTDRHKKKDGKNKINIH